MHFFLKQEVEKYNEVTDQCDSAAEVIWSLQACVQHIINPRL